MNDDLPPLPECPGLAGYTDDQMRDYTRAALAVRGEPVAWRLPKGASFISAAAKKQNPITFVEYTEPLYTAPRTPLTLTDEQIEAAWRRLCDSNSYPLTRDLVRAFARAVLAALEAKK